MADLRRVKLMRGNESTRTTVIPEQGEQISTIDELKVYLGDGIKPGGYVVNADNTITACLDQADVSTKHSLAWWIAWFNGSDATIRIPKGIHNISTNMTVPSNICLKFDKGAYFNVASGVTLTVNGDIDAGIWEVYTGSGTVNGTAYHPTRPEMPTPEYTDDSNRIATTAFVKDVLSTSPVLTGTPTAPTPEYTDDSDRIATTAFVKNVFENSPVLDGTPTAPTASPGTNNTQIATTAYADAKVADSITEDVTTVAPSQNAVFDALALKADLDSPVLTGTPTAPTASTGTNTTQIATTEFVKSEINSVLSAADALIFKGTLGTGGTITTLPTSDYKIGWTYKVITAGTYAGNECEVGDMIVSIVDFNTVSNDSDWIVIQANLDGIVIGPASAIDTHIAIFDGITGKLIKDSGYTIETSVPAGALFTDTVYTHPESGVVADTYTSVTVDVNGHVTGGTNPTTLSEYGITDAAPLESPNLTGTPTAPTAVAGTNSTQIATTAYADALVAESITDGVTGIAPSQDVVFDALALKADITYVNTSIDEYKVSNLVPTYIDSTSFSVPGDHTGLFTSNRMLRIYDGSNTTYIPVTSSSYDGINEITTVVSSGTVPIGIEIISYGILQNSATEIIRHEILNSISIINNYKSFTATSSQTDFDISDIYQHSNIIVFINGAFKLINIDFTVDDTIGAETVVLTNPCSGGETVVVYFNTLELTI